jgi:hypothetical protein
MHRSCCDICDIRSSGEQSGLTTGRLGSTGLRAMPSEGRHSRHSGASTADNAPRLDTISDDYGPATCRSMDLSCIELQGGPAATCRSVDLSCIEL